MVNIRELVFFQIFTFLAKCPFPIIIQIKIALSVDKVGTLIRILAESHMTFNWKFKGRFKGKAIWSVCLCTIECRWY